MCSRLAGSDRCAVALAGHHEDRRKGWGGKCAGPDAETGIRPDIPGYSGGSPRDRQHLYEYRREHVGT